MAYWAVFNKCGQADEICQLRHVFSTLQRLTQEVLFIL